MTHPEAERHYRRPPPLHRHAPVNALGYLGLTFAVDDIDDTLERHRHRGARLVGEVVRYENAYRLCYIRGPGGCSSALPKELGCRQR